jgi:hypothetical protein
MSVMTTQSELNSAHSPFPQKLFQVGFTLFVLALIFFIFSGTVSNIDLWVHIQSGLDNLTGRSLATIDQYSYLTDGQHWVNNEWLSQVILALAWSGGSVIGLVILKLITGFITIGIVYWNLYLQRIDLIRSGLIILVGSVLLASDFTTIYPQIFSLPLFAFLLFVLLRADEGLSRWLWVSPLIFLVWANINGSFLVGLGFYLLWALIQLLTHWMNWKKIILPVAVSVLATVLNPNWLMQYQYLFQSSSTLRPETLVMSPLTLMSPLGIIYIFTLVVAVIGFIFSRRNRSISSIILFGVGALLPFAAKRYLSFYAITAMILAGEHIAGLLERSSWVRRQSPRTVWAGILVILAAVGVFLLALPGIRGIAISQSPPYPVQAVQIIKNSQVTGNLATEYNWGGYAIWHLSPDIKVSIDGRGKAVYSPDTYTLNMAFLLGLGDWSAILDDYPTDMVLVNDHSPVFNLMKLLPGWVLIYQDYAAALYVREGSPLEEPLRQEASQFTPVPDSGFFP